VPSAVRCCHGKFDTCVSGVNCGVDDWLSQGRSAGTEMSFD
jgi:hypothetical protein